MVKTLGKNRENTMETEETAEQLKAPKETENELESTTKIRLEKNIIRPKKDLDNKDKKHLTTKRYHYDRNRESEKQPRQPKDKEIIKHEMKNKEKKKTHKLKNEHTTINSYTSKEEEIKAKTRQPEKYRPRFTAAYIESPGNSTQTALRQYSEKTNVRQNGKLDEPSMENLSPYSLTKQLKKILCELQDTNVTLTTIGRTAAYNDVILLQATELHHDILRTDKMSAKYEDDPPEKKIIFIVHGLNIWGFTELPYLYEINNFVSLLKNYLEHLDKFDIYLIPMANPDGVSFSLHHPIWNKNMSPQDACPGVMLDRNFDVAWNEGPLLSSCSQYYPGDHAFSEYETQAIREVFHRLSHKIVAYIHVHGGGLNKHVFKGDAVLYPKGFTATTGDDDKYVDLKGEIDEAMRNASFKVMSVAVDSLYNWYGKVTGTSVDYASTVYGIPYALDFSMQVYGSTTTEEDFFDAAQNEIWHRLIDVIFRYIYKTAVKQESATEVRKLKKI
ncbi:mast cell carboxypeptidase A-like [Hyposmocoma kahamanoa]|uniref:mast cell carboxypeptidase A-like n=1 Tax=Hyposmocoma kahamanoa TaxID=1477025 RepID=UPI000E6D95C7|nr:mast cell carboxypeptidase A-like [Hyposmocoma kahamanoa]